jgi:hypothetical protein
MWHRRDATRSVGHAPSTARTHRLAEEPLVSETPGRPLTDDDIRTTGSAGPRTQRDADTTDADADTTDVDATDATDGADADTTDADTTDADTTDADTTDADTTDADADTTDSRA